ncbi:hypothetical protein TYRP_006179 [Tyrophagus putrescentiae]|nr:hypothetical protein TYRP_006179 [Tyrophagus putrescentiae]
MTTVRKRMLETDNDKLQLVQLMLYESKQTSRTPHVVVTLGQLIRPKLQQLKLPTHNAAAKDARMVRSGLQSERLTPSAVNWLARMKKFGLQSGRLTPSAAAKDARMMRSELLSGRLTPSIAAKDAMMMWPGL